ncbi:hypothetical protein MITS9509_03485 [Synechococcus sp. MIT S9509]|nr:hypothetical protein MITS9509_03485 [Synechococcus sp. MIT S9509]
MCGSNRETGLFGAVISSFLKLLINALLNQLSALPQQTLAHLLVVFEVINDCCDSTFPSLHSGSNTGDYTIVPALVLLLIARSGWCPRNALDVALSPSHPPVTPLPQNGLAVAAGAPLPIVVGFHHRHHQRRALDSMAGPRHANGTSAEETIAAGFTTPTQILKGDPFVISTFTRVEPGQ